MATNTEENILLLTDSYKLTHWKQYPPGIEKVYSYFESRGGVFPETMFFGLQYILKRYLEGKVVTQEKIEEAEAIANEHFGRKGLFNKKGWEYVLNKYGGMLPVSISAVPEGLSVPTHNVLMTIENTDPKCFWLTNYLETLLVQAWYPTTVATLSMHMKKLIYRYLEETGDPDLIDFKLHDFGFRGVSSVESAATGGAAHLLNFRGTDTLEGIMMLKRHYGANMAGFSIPAAEHSTITSWGKDHEKEAYENMLKQYPDGMVAVVSDSYDIYRACGRIWGVDLQDQVRRRNGTVVIRPDSGIPEEVICKVMDRLGDAFIFWNKQNEKGYYVLPDQLRVIQGDGIDYKSTGRILEAMKKAKWSADNIAFGMGGALLQKLNRDTQKFAFKCSSVTVNGEERDVYKKPVTDSGKNSKAGRLKLLRHGNAFRTVREEDAGNKGILQEAFRDGTLLRNMTYSEVRENAERSFRTSLLRDKERNKAALVSAK